MTATVEEPRSSIVAWEATDCLLCGSPQRLPVIEARQGSAGVVRCRACGLCYTSPRPARGSMAAFYPDDYEPHQGRPKRRRAWRRPRVAIARHGEGRLLDFGCGHGSFLETMHSLGWEVLGVDFAETAVRRIRGDLGLPAVLGDLFSAELAGRRFDLITMRHSLEHVHGPREMLEQARRLLVPGGRLMVWVPNVESLPARWFGPAWFGLDLPRHLVHFAPSTLRRMVTEAGFHVDRQWMVSHSSWVQRSARQARREGRLPIALRLAVWRPAARAVAWYCRLRGRSDCIAIQATRP